MTRGSAFIESTMFNSAILYRKKVFYVSPIFRIWSTGVVSSIGLMLLIITVVHFKIQLSTDFHLHQLNTTLYQTFQVDFIEETAVDRSTCCLSSEQQEDICGRGNCVWPCPKAKPVIAELENNEELLKYRDGQRAFFLETSGSGELNYRQSCAIESLARHNPNLTVYVLFIEAKIHTEMTAIQHLQVVYNNIRLISVNMNDFLAGTRLEYWYHCTDWRDGQFHVSHLSDGLRFLTLSKYGGFYFDLDVIQVRPVTYYRNFVAEESTGTTLGSCAIHADYRHPLMEMATTEFTDNYIAEIWGYNGPDLLRRVLMNWCDVKNISSMNYVKCKAFNVLPFTTFNPIVYNNHEEFFMNRSKNETGNPPFLTDQVVGVHLWNKLSWNQSIYKNSTQYYTRLARSNCPSIFEIAPNVF